MKHSKHAKQEGKRNFKGTFIAILVIFVLIIVGLIVWKMPHNFITISNKNATNFQSMKDDSTVEGEKLVFKSTSAYNKIMEYTFENKILKTVKIYEQFENEEDFKNLKEQYENKEAIKILNINEKEKSIEIEKLDFGSDKDKSYEEIYDKYLVQIIGAYEQI